MSKLEIQKLMLILCGVLGFIAAVFMMGAIALSAVEHAFAYAAISALFWFISLIGLSELNDE